jgi:hypothetical protein
MLSRMSAGKKRGKRASNRTARPAAANRSAANRQAANRSAGGRPAGGRPAGGRSRDPAFRQIRDTVIDSLSTLFEPSAISGAYDAELAISVVLGVTIQAGIAGDQLADIVLDVADELVRRNPPYAYLALRALAVVGPPETTGYAGQAAARIVPAHVTRWVEDIGNVTPGTCTLLTDAYGETRTLLCEFTYADGARPHGVFAVIDATWHGAITRLIMDDTPAKTRRSLAKQARRDGLELREIPGQEAGAILMAGIDAFLHRGRGPEVDIRDDGYSMLCSSLCLARSRAGSLVPPELDVKADDVAERWPQEARQRLVTEFLASPHARDLRGCLDRKMPFLMITTCVDQLGCDPQLIGPALLKRILLTVLPATLLGPDRFGAAVGPPLRAWTAWLAERQDMPARECRLLTFQLKYLLRKFEDIWNGGQPALPLRRYVQDLSDEEASSGELLSGITDRRVFAVPLPGHRGQGLAQGHDDAPREADQLDAADPRDRALITLLGLSARGLPQQRFAPYLPVIEQLWAGEPAGPWTAAQRMRDAGLSRDKILDRLARP